MNKYAGTQTEKNLKAAFAGESQARNSYTFFAEIAKKEGYEQIAAIFEKTADNERTCADVGRGTGTDRRYGKESGCRSPRGEL